MYNVSNAYKAALAKPVHRYKLRGMIAGINFTEADVLQSSFSVTNKCSNDGEVEIGGVYAAEMHITFVSDLGKSRYTWVGSEITVEEGLCIAPNSYEYVPLGVFYVSEANYTSEGIEITAFDACENLDKPLGFTQTTGTAYQIMQEICTDCGLVLANSDFSDFPNAAINFILPEENGLNSYRDLAGAVAQALCGFFTINRDGELELRQYGLTAVDEIDTSHRFEGGSFSDFVTRYTAIEYINSDGTTTVYSLPHPEGGLTYQAGKNPLMFDTELGREAVLASLSQIAFVPFSVGLAGTPAYDLGDAIKFTDGLADGSKLSCIMQYDYTFNASYMAEGFGKNPALYGTESAEQRQLTSVAQATVGKGVVFYPFTNASDITIEEDAGEVTLLTISFVTTDTTYVMLEGQAVLNIPEAEEGEDQPITTAKLTYYLDGDEILTIHPEWTWSEAGRETITFMYPVIVSKALIHRFRVTIDVGGCDVTINAGEVRAVVWGQNLAATSLWDGTIECEDVVDLIDLGGRAMTLDERLTDTLGAITITDPILIEIGVEVLEEVNRITVGNGIELADIDDDIAFGKNVKLQTWGAISNVLWSELDLDYHW